MLLQKKQLIKHYLECVFITKEKEGQESLRNATPDIFPDSVCLEVLSMAELVKFSSDKWPA